jgi:hypothetical protein
MNARARTVLAAGSVLTVAAAIVGGRWEAHRATHAEQRGIARLFAAAAANPVPDGYRIDSRFRCLLYKRGVQPFAYELCFDSQGRLVEAIDRLSGTPVASTLRSQPQDATIRVRSSGIDEVMRQMGAFRVGASRFIAVRYPPSDSPRLPPPKVPPGSGLPSVRP